MTELVTFSDGWFHFWWWFSPSGPTWFALSGFLTALAVWEILRDALIAFVKSVFS